MTQLRRIRQKYGLADRAITDAMNLDHLGIETREDLDALREQGIAEMERSGHSKAYMQWVEFERRGIGDALPSLHGLQGLGAPTEQVLQETAAAVRSAKQVFDPERMDARLEGLEIMGTPVEDWDAHDLLDHLHSGMTEFADGPARAQVMDLIDAVQNSPYGSLTSSIEINVPDPVQTFEVVSQRDETGDAYTDWRNGNLQQQSGLEGLMIGDGYNLDGLRNMGGGGGSYSVAHDAAYHQAMAEEDYDDE